MRAPGPRSSPIKILLPRLGLACTLALAAPGRADAAQRLPAAGPGAVRSLRPGERLEPLARDLQAGPGAMADPSAQDPDDPAARVVCAPRPAGGGLPADAWLVAAGDRVLGIGPDGRVDVLAQADPRTTPAPRFTWLATGPPDGAGDGSAVLWDARGRALWKLDRAGHLSAWAALPAGTTGPDGARREPGPAELEGLAVDRQGRVYALFRRGPGAGQVVRIEPDGTTVLLAGAAPGSGAVLGRAAGLALAPDGRALFGLDPDPAGPRLVRIALPDGAVTVRRLDLPPYRGAPRALGFSQGRLVLAGAGPAAFFQVDPDTGRGRRVYRDALRSGAAPDGDRPLRPGPCFHSGRSRDRCGSLGTSFRGEFAADGQGRLAVLSGGRAGLLVLDWDRPGARAGRTGKRVAAGAESPDQFQADEQHAEEFRSRR